MRILCQYLLYLLLSNCFNFELLFRFSNIGILSGWNLRIIYAYLRLSSSLYYCIVYYIIISIFPYTLYYTTTWSIFPIHHMFYNQLVHKSTIHSQLSHTTSFSIYSTLQFDIFLSMYFLPLGSF